MKVHRETKKLLNFVAKNEILHIFLYRLVASYVYIIDYSCIISFNLNRVMELKQFYNIATKVRSRKSATTFGDLPDCLNVCELYFSCDSITYIWVINILYLRS